MKLSEAGRPIEVLIVEDNPADRQLLTEALLEAALPVHATAAGDGEKALEVLASKDRRPDLVLLDISLPRIDGNEVLARVKDDPSVRSIPVIVLTSSTDPCDGQRVLDLGANSFVGKPDDLDGFRALVRAIELFWFSTADVRFC